MAITLIATAGASNANTYATRAEADTYHESILHTEVWDEASGADQDKALAQATRLLDENVDWVGSKVNSTQALRWFRYGVYDEDGYAVASNSIPNFLRDATAEFARKLLEEDLAGEPDTRGYKSMALGSMKIEIDKTDRDKVGAIPVSVKNMIDHYGFIKTGVNSVVKLVRT